MVTETRSVKRRLNTQYCVENMDIVNSNENYQNSFQNRRNKNNFYNNKSFHNRKKPAVLRKIHSSDMQLNFVNNSMSSNDNNWGDNNNSVRFDINLPNKRYKN